MQEFATRIIEQSFLKVLVVGESESAFFSSVFDGTYAVQHAKETENGHFGCVPHSFKDH